MKYGKSLIFVSFFILQGCDGSATDGIIDADSINEEVDSTSPWILSDTTDPMTDGRVLSAARLLEQDPLFNVEVTISCTSPDLVAYEISTFDKEGTAAEMPIREGWNELVVDALIRVDDQPAVNKTTKTRFNNSFKTQFSPSDYRLDGNELVMEMAMADKIALRIPLVNGSVDAMINQTDANIKTVLDACLPSIRAEAAKRAEAEKASKVRSEDKSEPEVEDKTIQQETEESIDADVDDDMDAAPT